MAVSLEKPDHITAEYLPGSLNVEADWQSRNSRNPSKWKLCPKVFKQVCQRRGMPKIDLFASRLSHQLLQYFAWKPDPFSQGTDVLQQIWGNQFLYAFPPFCLILQVLFYRKNGAYHTNLGVSNLVSPFTRNVYSSSTATSKEHKLNKPIGDVHPLIANRTLRLAVWAISGKGYLRREFHKQLPNL